MNVPQTGRKPLPLSEAEARKTLRKRHSQDNLDFFATDPNSEIRTLGRLALRRDDINDLFALGDLCASRGLTDDNRLLVFYVGKALIAYQRALDLDPKAFERNASVGFGTLIQSSQRSNATMNFYLAKIFAGRGDPDRAISYLYKAVEEGYREIDKIKSEPAFAVLAQDERFVKLMEAIGAAASTR